jgi:hypothetical protein
MGGEPEGFFSDEGLYHGFFQYSRRTADAGSGANTAGMASGAVGRECTALSLIQLLPYSQGMDAS